MSRVPERTLPSFVRACFFVMAATSARWNAGRSLAAMPHRTPTPLIRSRHSGRRAPRPMLAAPVRRRRQPRRCERAGRRARGSRTCWSRRDAPGSDRWRFKHSCHSARRSRAAAALMRKTPRGARGRGSQRSVGAETTRGAEAPARVTRPLGFISMARPAGGGKLGSSSDQPPANQDVGLEHAGHACGVDSGGRRARQEGRVRWDEEELRVA